MLPSVLLRRVSEVYATLPPRIILLYVPLLLFVPPSLLSTIAASRRSRRFAFALPESTYRSRLYLSRRACPPHFARYHASRRLHLSANSTQAYFTHVTQ